MTLILCADDFAQNKEISEGILDLAHQNRLSAISCMTQMPLWPELAPRLIELKNTQCGLHFNLTHEQKSLGYWLIHSQLRHINRDFIRDTFNEQCDAFEKHLKRAPDFIDGHQHVHALPIIRDVLIEVMKERYANSLPWLRNLNPIPNQKKSLKEYILHFATRGFSDLLIKHQIPHNRYFGGIYSLKPEADFKALLEGWIQAATKISSLRAQRSNPELDENEHCTGLLRYARNDDVLIMCHPGLESRDEGDPIRKARVREYEVLLGRHGDRPLQ
jgi:predicted glycoside hydrolase/deacetylase ChbG (UPF0249 family)